MLLYRLYTQVWMFCSLTWKLIRRNINDICASFLESIHHLECLRYKPTKLKLDNSSLLGFFYVHMHALIQPFVVSIVCSSMESIFLNSLIWWMYLRPAVIGSAVKEVCVNFSVLGISKQSWRLVISLVWIWLIEIILVFKPS